MANRRRGEVLWTEVVQVMVSQTTKAELSEAATSQGISQSALARQLIETGLSKSNETNAA